MLRRPRLVTALFALSSLVGCATELKVDDGIGGAGGAASTTATGTGGSGGMSGAGGGQGGGGGMIPDGGVPDTCTSSAQCAGLNDVCNKGSCVDNKCVRLLANQGMPCEDGLFCTSMDTCQYGGEENGLPFGACVGGPPTDCSPPSSCEIGQCDEDNDTCTAAPANEGATCDDKDPCTLDGVCANGACTGAPPKNCTIFDSECAVGVCDPVTGCKPMPKNDGATCDLGVVTPCATGQCMAGQCTPVPQNDGTSCTLSTPNPCATGSCMAGSCMSVPANEGMTCNDNLFCTVDDVCANGQCVGAPNPCAPPGGCYIATCDEVNDTCAAMPGNDGQACDDFNACTTGTTCASGACIGGMPTNEGMACDDGTGCTTGEFCTAGVCGGGMGPTVYFADDFKDNAKGWTLGTEWQIGATVPNPTTGYNGTADPTTDHTPNSTDNGIAGVVIGGNASTTTHAFYYLESPPFNTANAAGPVILGFYRWLNSDYTPYMQNTIDVWNGTAWVNVWSSGGSPGIQDSPPNGQGWTFVQHDLTTHKNAGMRIRFGFTIGSSGVFTIGSWNIDDVLVAGAACP